MRESRSIIRKNKYNSSMENGIKIRFIDRPPKMLSECYSFFSNLYENPLFISRTIRGARGLNVIDSIRPAFLSYFLFILISPITIVILLPLYFFRLKFPFSSGSRYEFRKIGFIDENEFMDVYFTNTSMENVIIACLARRVSNRRLLMWYLFLIPAYVFCFVEGMNIFFNHMYSTDVAVTFRNSLILIWQFIATWIIIRFPHFYMKYQIYSMASAIKRLSRSINKDRKLGYTIYEILFFLIFTSLISSPINYALIQNMSVNFNNSLLIMAIYIIVSWPIMLLGFMLLANYTGRTPEIVLYETAENLKSVVKSVLEKRA